MENPSIVDAQVYTDYLMLVTFENGDIRVFDIRPYLHGEVFKPLMERINFAEFTIDELGCIEWASGASLHYDTVYLKSVPYEKTI